MSKKYHKPFWFTDTLERDEASLTEKGIPEQYWGYISANGVPGTNDHDGLGAIYGSREDFIESMQDTKGGMGVAVVDGRDLETIRKWIGGRDWTDEEEELWIQYIKMQPPPQKD